MISPNMVLTSTSQVSIWGDEVSPTLELTPLIGSPSFIISHLNPQQYLPLKPKSVKDFLPQLINQTHSLPPIDITFYVNNILVWHHKLLWGHSYVFLHKNFLFITERTHKDSVSNFPVQWCHRVIEADPFNLQSHLRIISCEQGSFTVYNSFWAPS